MEVLDAENTGDDPWDGFVLGRCRRLAGLPEAHLAPDLPPEVLNGALATYLHLRPGELLLAILDPTSGDLHDRGCALTTRRLYWAGPPQSPLAGPPAPEDPEAGSPPPRCRSVAYADLARPVYRSRYLTRGIELGGDLSAPVPGLGNDAQQALVDFLNDVARAARDGLPDGPPAEDADARREQLRAILWQTGEARGLQQRGHNFELYVRAASPRVITTPVLVAACVGVFAIMTARGVSPVEPTAQDLYPWGANFGPAVIGDGEAWRLLSCMFLHFGLVHLAFNMWCLVKAGPLAERLFGHLGFAALYLLSGVGGSLASLCYHPMIVSAGASGAIFGIFGAMLGFSVAQRHALGAATLKPLRASVLSFVGYNILFGLANSGIDNAAHLGGLITGAACGLFLSRPEAASGAAWGQIRRLVGAAAIAGGLALIYATTRGSILARIEADPGIAKMRGDQQRVVDAYNGFMKAAGPHLEEYDRIASEGDAVARRLDQAEQPGGPNALDLDRLIARSDANEGRLRAIAVQDPSLREARDHMVSGQRLMGHIFRLQRAFLDNHDEKPLDGPDGYEASLASLQKETNSFRERIAEYVKAHQLVIQSR